MARFPTFHPTIDESLTVKIANLNKWGYLNCFSVTNGLLTWNRGGSKIASIGFEIDTIDTNRKQITFNYTDNGTPVNYKVEILAVPSNLGKGKRWYFVCPKTGNNSMNLIKPYNCKYFLHRSAFPSILYDSQKESKHQRYLKTLLGDFFVLDDLNEELYKKYRKSHYRGKPTPLVKKIEKVQQKIRRLERSPELIFR